MSELQRTANEIDGEIELIDRRIAEIEAMRDMRDPAEMRDALLNSPPLPSPTSQGTAGTASIPGTLSPGTSLITPSNISTPSTPFYQSYLSPGFAPSYQVPAPVPIQATAPQGFGTAGAFAQGSTVTASGTFGSFAQGIDRSLYQPNIPQPSAVQQLIEEISYRAIEHIRLECNNFTNIYLDTNHMRIRYNIECSCGHVLLKTEDRDIMTDDYGYFTDAFRHLNKSLIEYSDDQKKKVMDVIKKVNDEISIIEDLSNVEFKRNDDAITEDECIDPISCMEIK